MNCSLKHKLSYCTPYGSYKMVKNMIYFEILIILSVLYLTILSELVLPGKVLLRTE